MGEWTETNLQALLKFGNGKSRPKTPGNVPVYGGNGILDHADMANYDGETIVIGRVGAYCGATYFEDRPIWVSDNALSAKVKGENEIKFLFYHLKNLRLNQFAEGSSHPLVTHTLLNAIETTVPTNPKEQKAIAEVLSSLDDKIDLLQRQNKTLESLAETLFRHWLIDSAQDNWQRQGLLDVIEIVGGGTPKTSNVSYWDGDVPWLSGGDIASAHKSFAATSAKTISMEGLKNSPAKLLPKFATIISARGTVGKYCMLARPMAFSQSNYGVLPRIKNTFCFSYLLINYIVDELQSAAYGSVFDTITTTTFSDVKLKIPDCETINRFELQVAPIFQKKIKCVEQVALLQKFRDTLLPKLMSGDVRVSYEVAA